MGIWGRQKPEYSGILRPRREEFSYKLNLIASKELAINHSDFWLLTSDSWLLQLQRVLALFDLLSLADNCWISTIAFKFVTPQPAVPIATSTFAANCTPANAPRFLFAPFQESLPQSSPSSRWFWDVWNSLSLTRKSGKQYKQAWYYWEVSEGEKTFKRSTYILY